MLTSPEESDTVGIIEELRESFAKLGPVRAIIRTPFGIASGHTRKQAVPEWPQTYKEVADYYAHLKIAAADNIHETKPSEWWTHILAEAAKELQNQGIEKGKIAARLEQDFPLHKRTIYRYLPKEFKTETRPEGPQKIDTVSISPEKSVATMTTESAKESHLREPTSYPSPGAGDYRQSTYTPSHVALASALSSRGIPFLTEVAIERPGEFTKDGKPKAYQIDILVGDKIAVEVEGKGSSSRDNEERDKFLEEKGYAVLHFANEEVSKNLEGCLKRVNIAIVGVEKAPLGDQCPRCGLIHVEGYGTPAWEGEVRVCNKGHVWFNPFPKEERVVEVGEGVPARAVEGQPQRPPLPSSLERVVEQIEIGVRDGHFTWRDLLVKMDAKMTMQLAASYRTQLMAGSKCPVCGHKIPETDDAEQRDEVIAALQRLEQSEGESR